MAMVSDSQEVQILCSHSDGVQGNAGLCFFMHALESLT